MKTIPTKKNLRLLSVDDIKTELKTLGEKPFRAKQIMEWLWVKGAREIDDMTNLSLELREKLKAGYVLDVVQISDEQKSADGTVKLAFKLADGFICEGVLIPAGDRMTACVSSQVGCSLACAFCATGRLKRERNLNFPEIYDQVFLLNQVAQNYYQQDLSNIVFMGMGEPLLNYGHLLKGIEKITSEEGLHMAARRITVSTAGVAKMINKLANDNVRFPLALSLHAANDQKRTKIMEINETNSLDVLSEALTNFYEKTGNQITLEYIIFKDFNDKIEDAQDLHVFAKQFPCKINIIEYNPIDDGDFEQAEEKNVNAFVRYLEFNKLIVNVRRS
ncbi:MAG: 23S rRNA (adenine(2503)-C(2))-methyltransferase RlmN, partial [Flavobacteriales bacterium]